MFQQLWDEDPWIQEMKAEAQAKGLAEGKAEGKAEGEASGALTRARWDVLRYIQKRFPKLVTQTQEKVEQLKDIAALDELLDQVYDAFNEEDVLAALSNTVDIQPS